VVKVRRREVVSPLAVVTDGRRRAGAVWVVAAHKGVLYPGASLGLVPLSLCWVWCQGLRDLSGCSDHKQISPLRRGFLLLGPGVVVWNRLAPFISGRAAVRYVCLLVLVLLVSVTRVRGLSAQTRWSRPAWPIAKSRCRNRCRVDAVVAELNRLVAMCDTPGNKPVADIAGAE